MKHATLSAVLCVSLLPACRPATAPEAGLTLVRAGAGAYRKGIPVDESGPADKNGQQVKPAMAPGLKQAPQTNDFWSSLIWHFDPGESFSQAIFAHPLSAKSSALGFEIGYPDRPQVSNEGFFFPHRADLVVGMEDWQAKSDEVLGYGDFSVTTRLTSGESWVTMTLAHGLPIAFFESKGGRPKVSLKRDAVSSTLAADTWCGAVENHNYCVFAKEKSALRQEQGQLTLEANTFSVAILPDLRPETVDRFRTASRIQVTGSRVTFHFDETKSQVATHYELELADGARSEQGLLAMYRHQSRRSQKDRLSAAYQSARGPMDLWNSASFTTISPAGTMLPLLPDAGVCESGRVAGLLQLAMAAPLFRPGLEGSRDSYWDGKNLGRTSRLALIADQCGLHADLEELLNELQLALEDWFDGSSPRYFYYDPVWKTLIGSPTMYHSGRMLNDHHFHYGYYVYAAAVVGLHRPDWLVQYGPMVELLIRDAGSPFRDDQLFPYLRHFDPYAGHSWASGTSTDSRGNNQESSSEDLNFAAAVALYGEVTQKPVYRDLGVYLHSILSDSVAEYWYDVHAEVYPKDFSHKGVGIVWGSGASYDTWFSYQPAFIHGIQLTPMHSGMRFWSRYPDRVREVLAHAELGNGGELRLWRDMFWLLESQVDPEKAHARFEKESYFEPEFGSSMVALYHELVAAKALGVMLPGVTANSPFAAAFEHAGKRSYAAFSAKPRGVSFSDGHQMKAGRHVPLSRKEQE